MKSYKDILLQIGRIDALFSASDFNPRLDKWYTFALSAFYKYKANMTKYLAKFNEFGKDAGENHYWALTWEKHKDTKLPRTVYAGY